jgi:hypothetical protein
MPEYIGDAGKARVVLAPDTNAKFILMLSWEGDVLDGPKWSAYRRGTREELVPFIEVWLPRCPDPDLLGEALEKLSAQIPEGVL